MNIIGKGGAEYIRILEQGTKTWITILPVHLFINIERGPITTENMVVALYKGKNNILKRKLWKEKTWLCLIWTEYFNK